MKYQVKVQVTVDFDVDMGDRTLTQQKRRIKDLLGDMKLYAACFSADYRYETRERFKLLSIEPKGK